ncbi:GlxA family transcriptional regulator [Pedobacter cryoconitis]|uniref:Transcriptional regulator GlxA family with amidase domain n=1 Tax=Pedobacter cryoconitis TaxID=188932 RepID=A0A7X0J2X9_9SPHI|nr:GlxA family transcriptional regulator [Pedobacter cryoconitis]MBB6499905.1 transcriptional regulator GlxA family with amidase domain [Pedobacter cryoconitis]
MEQKLIVLVAIPDSLSLDLIGAADVFSCANHFHKDPVSNYKIVIASATKELTMTMTNGLNIHCSCSIYEIKDQIDTLIIAGFSADERWNKFPQLVEWLKTCSAGIRRVASVCVGAFILAEAGLLNGKRATTHWRHCKELNDKYEGIVVDPDPIFVKDGHIYTSAGASAGIDLALAMVEEDYDCNLSIEVARWLVLYLRRPGNQSQFSSLLSQQLSSKKPIKELQQWIASHLKEDLSVTVLAERIAMSPRNFSRVFTAETGFTPARYIERLRVESGRRYIEETKYSLDEISMECGFGSADTMRKVFLRNLKISPFDYRSLFGSG